MTITPKVVNYNGEPYQLPYALEIPAGYPLHGTTTLSADATSFVYTPDAGFCGDDVFPYIVQYGDPIGKYSSRSKVTVSVGNCGSPPSPRPAPGPLSLEATDQEAATPAETPGTVVLDVWAQAPITFTVLTPPTNGTLSAFDPIAFTVTYTPNRFYCNSFDAGNDTFAYTATNPRSGKSASASVTMYVDCPPPPKVLSPVFKSVVAPNGALIKLDLEGTPPLRIAVLTQPAGGTVAADQVAQTLAYKPQYDYCDLSGDNFDFSVTDPYGQETLEQGTVVAECPPAPTALNQDYKKAAGAGDVPVKLVVTGTAPLGVEVTSPPFNGNLSAISNITFTGVYAPNFDYCSLSNSPDTAYFVVSDRYGQSSQETVLSFDIVCPKPPTALDQEVTVPPQQASVFPLNATCSLPANLDFEPPLYGDVEQVNSTLSVLYTPNPEFCSRDGEPDTFRYTVSDLYGQEASATVVLQVPCPDPPTANDQSFTIPAGTNLTFVLNYTSTSPIVLFEEAQPPLNGFLPNGAVFCLLVRACRVLSAGAADGACVLPLFPTHIQPNNNTHTRSPQNTTNQRHLGQRHDDVRALPGLLRAARRLARHARLDGNRPLRADGRGDGVHPRRVPAAADGAGPDVCAAGDAAADKLDARAQGQRHGAALVLHRAAAAVWKRVDRRRRQRDVARRLHVQPVLPAQGRLLHGRRRHGRHGAVRRDRRVRAGRARRDGDCHAERDVPARTRGAVKRDPDHAQGRRPVRAVRAGGDAAAAGQQPVRLQAGAGAADGQRDVGPRGGRLCVHAGKRVVQRRVNRLVQLQRAGHLRPAQHAERGPV